MYTDPLGLRALSDPVRGARHERCGAAHEFAHRPWQGYPSCGCCSRAVRDLLRPHRFKYGTAADITRRQSAKVFIEMSLDLALGLGHEAEAGAILGERCERADREGAGIPERVEQARAG